MVNNNIIIKGACTHNLKNVSLELPRNKVIVFTGVSGSGKSSLAMDTLFAEGQRKYAESLNSYARQFLMRMRKPEVDFIKNLSPAIAIDQSNSNNSPRSTVGTLTEIYEYVKLLFARIGEIYSPRTNNKITLHNKETIRDYLLKLRQGTKVYIVYKTVYNNKTFVTYLNQLIQKGFVRIWVDDTIFLVEEILNDNTHFNIKKDFYVLVDRLIIKDFEEADIFRISDSIEIALYEGHHEMQLILNDTEQVSFSNNLKIDEIEFIEPTVDLFAFNNSYGACYNCKGYGLAQGIDELRVIPNKNLSIYDNAIIPWSTSEMSYYKKKIIEEHQINGIPIFTPIKNFTQQEYDLLWNGSEHLIGINNFFDTLKSQSYKIQYRTLLARYTNKTICSVCKGSRLRPEANYIKVGGITINEMVSMPIDKLLLWFKNITLDTHQKDVSKRIVLEINNRLRVLNNVGLGYLTLNRPANTLSGGESQRIKLTLSLGSTLTDSIYILDEPSIGLHSRDTEKLIKVLNELKEAGNTVIVVEHDETMMQHADYIVDMGPEASYKGGEVVAQGTFADIKKDKKSLTARYLNRNLIIHRKRIDIKNNFLELQNVTANNLQNINVKIPLQCLCVISGVSGSGKTTLVKKVLYPALQNKIYYSSEPLEYLKDIQYPKNIITNIEMIDQNPIGRSSRSNPISYIGGFDELRNLFARQPQSKLRNYTPGVFSFNVPGGRCEECQGEGEVTVEMQFLADVKLVCENCNGKRYKSTILEITYKNKNISDVLALSVDEALILFNKETKIIKYLQALQDVGLGYIHLGQSSSTLSGGEAQRIKLATFLLLGNVSDKYLFIFDEPTTGLHFHDIQKLLQAFQALLLKGHSIIIVEHNLEVIKNADWIIELGPEAGEQGGEIIFEGLPEQLKNNTKSFTANYL